MTCAMEKASAAGWMALPTMAAGKREKGLLLLSELKNRMCDRPGLLTGLMVVRHGQGVLTRASGYKYDGQWLADKESGIGEAPFPFPCQQRCPRRRQPQLSARGRVTLAGNARLADKSRYTGDFLEGKPHGKGRLQTADGERYEGLFVEGRRHGEGRCISANGDRYVGENTVPTVSARRRVTHPHPHLCRVSCRAGDWAHNKRHGEGTCQFADGTLFRGAWQDDQWVQTEAEPSFSRVAGPGLGKRWLAKSPASQSWCVSKRPLPAPPTTRAPDAEAWDAGPGCRRTPESALGWG